MTMEKKGQINVYVCPAGHKTITENLDDGTTPMIIGCEHPRPYSSTLPCGEMAKSSFYRVDQTLKAGFEWYKPTDLKAIARRLREHVRMGGLLLRKKRKVVA